MLTCDRTSTYLGSLGYTLLREEADMLAKQSLQ